MYPVYITHNVNTIFWVKAHTVEHIYNLHGKNRKFFEKEIIKHVVFSPQRNRAEPAE